MPPSQKELRESIHIYVKCVCSFFRKAPSCELSDIAIGEWQAERKNINKLSQIHIVHLPPPSCRALFPLCGGNFYIHH